MDIGCNLGYFVLSMAERGLYAIGIDMSPGYRVILYEDSNYRGTSYALTIDASTLQWTPIGNDNLSSLKIEKVDK